ncbi:hypothetical protein CLOP_g23515 [Closterium sp. NIES-67]|nr:hypothetical protein CLOP_g23515 [Closterium sp. NIES-67]
MAHGKGRAPQTWWGWRRPADRPAPLSPLASVVGAAFLLLVSLAPTPHAASASRGPVALPRGRDSDTWQRVADRDNRAGSDSRYVWPESAQIGGSRAARRGEAGEEPREVDARERAHAWRSPQELLATSPHARDPRPDALLSRMERGEASRRRRLSMSFLPRHHPRRAPGTCWSRLEAKMYWTAVKTKTAPSFVEALVAYRKMHARCINGVRDWDAFFRNKDNGQHPNVDLDGCKYLFWMAPGYAGLGNNLMSLVSAMTYSLLTGRAIIIAPGTDIASFLCNPFDESNWAIPARDYKHVYLMFQKQPRVAEFARMAANGTQWSKKAAFADLRFSYGEEDWKFFCAGVQAAIAEARFVAFYTDEYTVPGFYMLPTLQATLEEWFPDGRVFLHVARAVLHPANYMWQRITRAFHAHLKHHNRRVGMQVRTFYRRDTDTNPRILECAVNVSGYLPRLFSNTQWDALSANPDSRMQAILRNPFPRSVAVLLTSLSQHHMDYLHEAFATHETVDGTVVALHSEGHEGLESAKQRQHEKAFLEMWLLSFSDELLVSDMSSFGYIASGLSGINPYSLNIGFRTAENLNWYTNRRPVCARSSSEPCFLSPPEFLKCDDSDVKKELFEQTSKIRKCLNINRGIEVDIPLF